MSQNSRGTLGIHVERNVEVLMRDGVILRANVFRPAGSGTYPGLLLRTPYKKPKGGFERYVRSGYVVVTQDSRGRYASDGDWVPYTVGVTQDGEDGYDSVEWLAKQPYCNGKVGTIGTSYEGWMQWVLARHRPPSLVAMCACSIPLENTEVDWWGSFRPGRRIRWWMSSMAPDIRRRKGLPPPHTKEEAQKIWDEIEHNRWLTFMPWMDFPKYLPEGLREYAEDWLSEPHRRCWKFDEVHKEVEVPNLDFSGWYDHCNGTMAHVGLMQKHARTKEAREQTKIVIGPWNHQSLGQRSTGDIDYGPDAQVDRVHMTIRWFDFWLKGLQNGMAEEPAVRYFVMGSCTWKEAETWPPTDLGQVEYHLDSDGDAHLPDGSGRLLTPTPSASSTDTYDYDPNDPMPTLWTRELFTEPADRQVLSYRQDILKYRSAPIEEELEVVGCPEAVIFAATSAKDTDFFARLIDEYADGRAMEICYGMIRARHRSSLEHEEFIEPGEIVEYRVRLGPTACRFQKGHRIRLEITSSDYPNHDRNHNTGGDDLRETELVAARQTVYHTAQYPSRIILPIANSK